jgi:hypothetical protein
MQVNARLVLASCLTVMTAGAVSGCSVFERDASDGGLPAYTAETGPSTLPAKAVSTDDDKDPGEAVDAATSDDADALVDDISLTAKDVRKRGLKVRTDSDDLDDPTLFGCGGGFPSEAHRVARHRVTISGGDIATTGVRVYSDVVAYDSQDAATAALGEWGELLEECKPDQSIDMLGVRGLTRDEFESLGSCDLPAGAAQCARVSVMFDNDEGEKTYTYTVAQRNGAVLALVTRESRTAPAKAQTAQILELAKPIARRLTDNT